MKKILIIEDESSMRNSLEEFFSEEGFEVTTAMDGESGYEMIRSKKFDVILLDIILPRMDGFEILNKIKEEEVEHAPIVLLTNLGEAENIQKALDLGATTYLIKSDYQLKEIIDKVNAVIETKEKN